MRMTTAPGVIRPAEPMNVANARLRAERIADTVAELATIAEAITDRLSGCIPRDATPTSSGDKPAGDGLLGVLIDTQEVTERQLDRLREAIERIGRAVDAGPQSAAGARS